MSKKIKRVLITGIALITVFALVIGTVGIIKNIQFPKKKRRYPLNKGKSLQRILLLLI